ncbi:MAG: hypothetical protein DRP83_01240 [Planctomycetota bacterium]|nr:MAG: hypothetical protein DRP83_01240 [Planctomycetota bacterium]
MQVLFTLFPVFAVITLGAILRKTNFVRAEFDKTLSELVYWVALPCLLFYNAAIADYEVAVAGRTVAVVFGGMIGSLILGYIVSTLLKLKPSTRGVFVQGAFRGNLAYIGLPVVVCSFTETGNHAVGIAVVVVAIMVSCYNAAAITVLLSVQHKLEKKVVRQILQRMARNPLLLSCISGIIYSLFFQNIPVPIGRTLSAIGQMSLPLALLCIGGTLVNEKIVKDVVKAAFISSLIKIMGAPLIGYLMIRLIDIGEVEKRIAMIMLACPTAVSSHILAGQIGGDEKVSAAIVVISSTLSVISLGVVVWLF